GGAVRTGLAAVAGLPAEVRDLILEERGRGGPFRALADFRRRVRPGPEALAVLIRAGAFDWTGRPRPALLLEADLQDRARLGPAELFPQDPASGWSPAAYSARQPRPDDGQLLGL